MIDLADQPGDRRPHDRVPAEAPLRRVPQRTGHPRRVHRPGRYSEPETARWDPARSGSPPSNPAAASGPTRNPDYWDGPPHLDELEIVISNDEAARVNALLGRQIEYAHDLTPTSARTHENSGQLKVHRLPLSNFHGLAMKIDRPPFDRPELRQALFHLVDREELVRSVLHGSGQLGNDLYGKSYRYYAGRAWPQRGPDLDQARSLLKQAGAEG